MNHRVPYSECKRHAFQNSEVDERHYLQFLPWKARKKEDDHHMEQRADKVSFHLPITEQRAYHKLGKGLVQAPDRTRFWAKTAP